MTESKTFRLLLTTGRPEEEVLRVMMRKCHPCRDGVIRPPTIVEYEGKDYVLARELLPEVYIYHPTQIKAINEFLASKPLY